MTWTHAFLAAAMTRNRDGTDKKEPFFWHPKDGKVFVPPDGDNHARPVITVEGADPDDTFVLTVHQNRIEGRFRGQKHVLVRLD